MDKTTTIGVFPTRHQAEHAINALNKEGVADHEISCIYTDSEGDVRESQKGEKVGSGAAAGGATGAILGTIAGLVVANGVLPGLGTLFVAGPLATALGFTGAAATTVAGAATGAAAGGLIGALSHMGISEEDAALYEKHIKKGEAVLICKSDDPGIMDVLKSNGAMEVRQYNS